jgi:hypothetical protein
MMQVVMIGEGGVAANDPSLVGIMIVVIDIDEDVSQSFRLLIVENVLKGDGQDWELVDETEVTVRGQEVSLLVFEDTSESGERMRQVESSFFAGEQGQVMIAIRGYVSTWNQDIIDDFIRSIR